MNSLIDWLEKHSSPCPVKQNTGADCPGCGIQRSFIELFKGNLAESFYLYPALLPLLSFFIFLILHTFFKIPKGEIISKYLFYFAGGAIILSYLYKIIFLSIWQ